MTMTMTNRFAFVEGMCCPCPDPAPVGQAELVWSRCARNECPACEDGGARMVRLLRPVQDLGAGSDMSHMKWQKVTRFILSFFVHFV